MGDWVVRNAIVKGTFGHVYAVTNRCTGNAGYLFVMTTYASTQALVKALGSALNAPLTGPAAVTGKLEPTTSFAATS